MVSFVEDLNRDVTTLVEAGQQRLSPVQGRLNKKRRGTARRHPDAKYFKQPTDEAAS